MQDAESTRLITVSFKATTVPGAWPPSPSEIAGYLTGLLATSDREEPRFFRLFDPTVFTELVTVVIDMTGGALQDAGADVPVRVVGVDYEGDADHESQDAGTAGNDAAPPAAHACEIRADARPAWVKDMLEGLAFEGGFAGTAAS